MWNLRILLLVLHFALIFGQGTDFNDLNCQYEPLPLSLNSLSFLDFNGEFHSHAEYYANFTGRDQKVYFTLTQQSAFRIYVAAHEVDVDLWLYNATSGFSIGRSSLDVGVEEVILATLPAGKYYVQLSYFGILVGAYHPGECDLIEVQIQVVPITTINSRSPNFQCASAAETLPLIHWGPLANGDPISYNSDFDDDGILMNVRNPDTPPNNRRAVRWVTGYNFTVPDVKGGSFMWMLEATIGTEFIIGGSLGLLLLRQDQVPNMNCVVQGNCTIGGYYELNENTLKTLLVTGDYTLWIFDKIGEKNFNFSPCTPFSFRLAITKKLKEESFINCEAPRLPDSLAQEYDEPAGFLHYREAALVDLDEPEHQISFYTTSDTFFRAAVAPHRIDIDLRLDDANTGRRLEYSGRWGGEDAIATYLPPGYYNLTIIFFGINEPQFCETFEIEIVLGPAFLYPNFGYCFSNGNSITSLPDLSNLPTSLVNNNSFTSSSQTPYIYPFNGNYLGRPILRQNFTVYQTSSFYAELGYSFLLSDMELMVNNLDLDAVFYGEHDRNHAYLSVILEPGNYTLIIGTGVVQKSVLPNFPNCSQFTFDLNIKPLSQSGSCWSYRKLPKSFNLPQYLGVTGAFHLQDKFLAPLNGRFSVTDKIFFNVTQSSIFRMWTEPHIIDVDFYLYQNNRLVNRSDSFNNEEELVYHLLPGMKYELDVIYYHYAPSDPETEEPDCFLVSIEAAISPSSDSGPPCEEVLPADNTIPDTGTDNFYFENKFFYNQGTSSFVKRLPFQVTGDPVLFRAQVRYDFVYSNLGLRLRVNNQTAVFGFEEYNRNDLETLLLGPGSYALEIYEPARAILPEFRRCAAFDLFVGYQLAADVSNPSNIRGCNDTYFPPSLNTKAFLSPLTDYQVHFERNILVDVTDHGDAMEFTLTKSSIFRVFVPYHTSVDVDLILRTGTKANPGPAIVSNVGIAEEAISRRLDAGRYYVEVRYYAFRGGRLPSASECLAFPIEISVTPLTYLDSIPSLTTPCSTDQIPAQWQTGSKFNQTFSRALGVAFSQTATFVLQSPATFELDVRFNYPSGGLYVDFYGMVVVDGYSVNRTFHSQIGMNHAFIRKVLPPGQYTIVLKDPFPLDSRDLALACSTYQLAYFINTNVTGVNPCIFNTQPLPTDLFSEAGGSRPFGGPQDPQDGRVRIYGDTFLLTTDNGRDNFILFNAPVASFLRLYTKAAPGNDIDFFVYNNASRPPGSLVPGGSSIGTDVVESSLIKIPAQNNSYLVDVFFFRVKTGDECPTFTFELAMKPKTVVQQEVACPNQLPSPEVPSAYMDVSRNVWQYNENFVFTKSRIDQNTDVFKRFTYRITVNVQVNATLYTSIGFDFLANDFRLIFRNASDNSIISRGEASAAYDRNDRINFFNMMFLDVVPGLYYLDIVEDVNGKDLGVTEFCHSFSFFFAAFTANNGPSVDYVNPPTSSGLDPNRDLVVSITFSESVALPPGTSNLLTYLTTNSIVYLSARNAGSISPIAAEFDSQNVILTVTFSHTSFQLGGIYQLMVDASKLYNHDGIAFANPTDSFIYTMSGCDCSNHGTCDTSGSTLRCNCDTGYTGERCELCANGYVFQGDQCVPRQPCTNYTCNSHGTCDDSRGYPVCACDLGYATSGNDYCMTCATGFSGYPNCQPESEENSKDNRCTAPLIPDSLDSIAFLGYNGEVHLHGDYYIDTDNMKHDMYFTITQDSVLRAYTEPHWVDIDMYLYRLKDDGVTIAAVLDHAIAIGVEEALFDTIPGSSVQPGKYMMRFRYYIWGRAHQADCETFNFELAIMPFARAKNESTQMVSKCTGKSPSPPAFTGSGDYTYAPADEYSVLARNNATANKPYYFWKWNFQVVAPPGKIAVLTAEIGYRFLVGDLALLLEQNATQSHCGDQGGYADACQQGTNRLNRNRLYQLLGNGNYTLWIYEPEPQNPNITTCSLYTFFMNIAYVPVSQDLFYCDKSRLFPESLNAPGFMDSNGYMHIQETFLLSEGDIYFTLTQASVLRVQGTTKSFVSWQILDSANYSIQTSFYSKTPELLITLTPGTYKLRIASFQLSGTSCPVINVEMELSPNQRLPHSCTGTETLPPIQNIVVPFQFPSADTDNTIPTSYYAYTNNPVIAQYPFTLDQVSRIEAALDSDFLSGALRLVLEFQEQNNHLRTIYGVENFHQSFMRETLDPGQYTLKILRPDTYSLAPNTFPPCTEFNFKLKIKPVSSSDDPCLNIGEPLPTTFNSVRFLGQDNEFDYSQTDFTIPTFGLVYTYYVPFSVNTPSLIRVYTQPHAVDIDCALYLQSDPLTPVASGNFTFNEQEEFVYLLQPSTQYALRLYFWKWDPSNIPQCPTFNMEIAIVPIADAILPDKTCVPTPYHWPPSPPAALALPDNSYEYDSETIGETLFYQQSNTLTASPPITFTLTSPANVYAEINYNFINGDLLLKLNNSDASSTYFGVNQLNGNSITVLRLPAGNYSLYILEVTTNYQQAMGCSHFTFSLLIQKDSQDSLLDKYPTLPRNLDIIPFLKYDGRTHLMESYSLFKGLPTQQEEIVFSVTEPSLMRVSTAHYINNMDALQLVLYKTDEGVVYSTFYESLLELLQPGKYRLVFNPPQALVGTVVTEIQLAITPVATIANDLANFKPQQPPDCAEKLLPQITPNPNGYFLFGDDQLQFSQTTIKTKTILQTVPFVITIPSTVYAKVGYNFLIGDLELSVVGQQTTGKNITIYGRNMRNLNEVNDVLQAGSYQLVVSQELKFNLAGTESLAHCSMFSARIILQDASNQTTHVDCSTHDLVPWNLNTADGGSSNFGGPMQNGILQMLGTDFLMPTITGQVDTMRVGVTSKSILSVITKQRFFADISYGVAKLGSASIPPLVSMHDYLQRAELYVLDHPTDGALPPSNYTIDLHYSSAQRVACPYFGLQTSIKPIAQITQLVTCPQVINSQLPKNYVQVTKDAVYTEYVDSYLLHNDLFFANRNNSFKYDITLNITRTSRVAANLAFNSLMNMFQVRLFSIGIGYRYEVGRASFTMLPTQSGTTNSNLLLAGTINPGNYLITITHPNFRLPLLSSLGTSHCYPYIWDLQIFPDSDLPYINNVNPPTAKYLSPYEKLKLDVSFSDLVFFAGAEVTTAAPLLQSLYVQDVKQQGQKIFPTSAIRDLQTITTWHLEFPALFASASSYKLFLTPGIITDRQGRAIQLISSNVYSMIDTTCNNHGQFDRGYCFCSTGYAGEDCTTCAVGYQNVDNSGGLVCQKKSGQFCLVDSCGCQPNRSPCVPRGTCDDTSGSIVCKCQYHYSGDKCQSCESGYTFDPNQGCVPQSTCPSCVHGYCDSSSKKCVCDSHFKGTTCDECNDGWSGTNCADQVSTNKPGTKGATANAGLTALSVLSMTLALFFIVATVGFMLFRRFSKPKSYAGLNMSEIGELTELE